MMGVECAPRCGLESRNEGKSGESGDAEEEEVFEFGGLQKKF
jgi:hypothetical protein